MEFILDTADLADIRRCNEYLPIVGVTTNPSIVHACGVKNLFAHFNEIRSIIGEKTLHMQAVATKAQGIVDDAHAIMDKVDREVYVKVPVTMEGLKAMKQLKKENIHITATCVYQKSQGLLALAAGADYIAPYYNRMMNMDIDADDVIASIADQIANGGYNTKILAASFKNMTQVNRAFAAGAQSVTVQPQLLYDAFAMPSIDKAVRDFNDAWAKSFGDKTIADLAK